jgi:hypothetical protein
MRMGMRRFTRLTNGLSKKIQNRAAMVAIHFMYYNFASTSGKLTGVGIEQETSRIYTD